MASSGLYSEDGSQRVTVVGGTAGPSTVTANQGAAGAAPWPVSIASQAVPLGSTPRGVFTIAAGGLAAAVGLPNIPGDATTALVVPEGAGLRWRDDGTDPTAAVGVPAPVGSFLKLYGPEIAATKFIQQSAGASLTVRYGK